MFIFVNKILVNLPAYYSVHQYMPQVIHFLYQVAIINLPYPSYLKMNKTYLQ